MISIPVSEDLLLRAYEDSDANELFTVIDGSRTHLGAWLDWVSRTTKPEQTLQFIQTSRQQQHDQQALHLGIFYNGHIIGGVGMHHWDQVTRRAQAGYWICKEWEGKGIAGRCFTAFVTFLFEKLSMNKVELHFVTANKRSAKIAERLGFRIEGVVRQSTMRNGMREDTAIAGLLKNEWKPLLSA